MGLRRRLQNFLNVRANAVLDRWEDPRESLELAYQEQIAALNEARRGVADVLTSEKRLERELGAMQQQLAKQTQTAEEAARSGDEAGARRALERELQCSEQCERLREEIANVHAQRLALERVTERMQLRAEAFRTEKIALGARFAAAQAMIKAGESVTGLSSEMEEVAAMVGRAREKSDDAQARAAALLQLAGGADGRSLGADRDDPRIEARLQYLRGASPPQLPE